MTRFSYTAKTEQGDIKHGIIESHSLQAAREDLRKMKLDVQELQEINPHWSVDSVAKTPEEAVTPKVFEPAFRIEEPREAGYAPLTETIRLYAGWLLSWYILAYALGSYQLTRELPFQIPFVDGLILSPLVFSFTLGTFLYLLLTGINKWAKGGYLLGSLLTVIGIGVFLLYRINT